MNIHVKRYADPRLDWESSVEPEDRSWVLFVPRDAAKSAPQLWTRVGTCVDEEGTSRETYACATIADVPEAYLSDESASGLVEAPAR